MAENKKPVEKIQESVKVPQKPVIQKGERGIAQDSAENVVRNTMPPPVKPGGGSKK